MGNPYLLLYNAALVLGWGYCLYLTIDTMLLKKGTTADLWQVVELPLKVSQTAALLEVVHSAIGLVRSPVMITAMQVASRIWVLWGIINPEPVLAAGGAVHLAQPLPGVSLPGVPAEVGGMPLALNLATLLTAWSITEVVRYSFFAVKELAGTVPYPLLWLRYSTFLPLYPLGVASELAMVRLALPAIWARHLWSIDLPNSFNWAFDYPILCGLIVLSYLPGLPQLYLYMLAQRSKVLSGGAKPSSSAGKAKRS
ncbi:hypothetical protein CHLRE_03g167924v5 [Chlamydomonas reinhardtii]|uniref:Very-long-chain (3R)-3-hydroxyacyl-CoA dehydratase n=1 Tax=Chlamydomonas reinhardtii TaxID=3055 RepID=A0A2K3DWV5_CHLRE|nr:uncharacterized protein CHLRE_03g167924v5 [Chlamydomonas reinhardtii]PNW85014.1 hypothetical protein CHLRE_03g167924v5 [Chlamydomonas reinhardtii]